MYSVVHISEVSLRELRGTKEHRRLLNFEVLRTWLESMREIGPKSRLMPIKDRR